MAMFRPVTVITGASAGIGVALARVFAAEGHELVLVARREREMNALANELAAAGYMRPQVLPIDLTRGDGPARLGSDLAGRGLEPNYVVNNAGFGLCGAAIDLDRPEQLTMIDLNVRALTDLSLRWADSLRKYRGGVLNVASVGGFLPGPGMAVYYATKAYVLSFTQALHHELAPHGVRVTALCPGPVATEFQARAGFRPKRYNKLLKRSPEEVARAGYDGLKSGRMIVVPGFANKVVTLLPRILPRGLMLSLTGRRYEKGVRARAETRWRKRPSAPT